jgi:putative N6-adenine-specific DNA methylase
MRLIAKTLYGLEKVLAEELVSLGAEDVQTANRAVIFKGNPYLLYKVNYCARTAMSVLMQVREFRIRSADDLYKNGLKVDWEKYFGVDQTFSIAPIVNSPFFRHTGYAGLVLKDSIADRFRKRIGRRPSVETNNPGIVINLHISNDQVNISMDSSVVPLFKRGYRREQSLAPVNEVLAAGIILLSGWNATTSFMDPMCGSGTIPIEAALIACKIPPGKFRQFFGFQRWKDYNEELFDKVKKECDTQIGSSSVKICGRDISEDAVLQARANVETAGLSQIISIEKYDFRDLKALDDDGFIIMNPPYGQRISPGETDNLYSMIGSTLKHSFPGNKAFIITSNKESLKHVGLKPKEKITLYNGALECVLVKYELYPGTKKKAKA